MGFADDINRFSVKIGAVTQAVFVGVAAEAQASIQHGSAVTGSPGQPVDEGGLVASFQLTFPAPNVAEITTNLPYAESNEDGIARPGGGPYIQRSPVGGRHSISKTIDGMPRIVEHVTKQLTGGGA